MHKTEKKLVLDQYKQYCVLEKNFTSNKEVEKKNFEFSCNTGTMILSIKKF